jgi:plasmid stabilization system protein ParE
VKSYILTERARTGLSAIAIYVCNRFDADVAIATVEKIEKACQTLAENPGLGHLREDLTSDEVIRFWPVGPSLLAYRPTEDGIVVLFIERGNKDWKRLLE